MLHPPLPKNGLHDLRVESGYTVQALADAVGVTRDTIFRWERCDRKPKLTQVEKLARVFRIQPNDIFEAMAC